MALAPSREMLIAAVEVGNLGSGVADAIRGFVTELIGGKEKAEQLYLGIVIMKTVGSVLGTIAWSAAFRECMGRAHSVLRVPYVGLMAAVMGGIVVLRRVGRRARRMRDGV